LGFTSYRYNIGHMATFQLYWWRNTSGEIPCIISGTNGHLNRTNERSIISKYMMLKTNTFNCNRFCEIRENKFYIRNVGFSSWHRLPTSYVGKMWFGNLSCNGTEADIMQCRKPTGSVFEPYILRNHENGHWLYCFGKSNNN
jgi:hypothetical protein